jgi:hypothetical protein
MESLPPMLHWLTHQLERHRFGVPVILPTREQQPPFAYSVGLSLHGLPELIVVGLAEPGGALIQRLGRAALDGAVDLRAGASSPPPQGSDHRAVSTRSAPSGWTATRSCSRAWPSTTSRSCRWSGPTSAAAGRRIR